MGIDYYGVLNLNKCAAEPEIKQEYRRLALKLHPDKPHGEEKKDEEQFVTFSIIGEAYEVLTDKFLRAVYDQYGEEGLKAGVPGPNEYIQPYAYHGDPMRTYRKLSSVFSPPEKSEGFTMPQKWNFQSLQMYLYTFSEFFGTTSPYADLLDVLYHPLPLYNDGIHIGVKKKDLDVFHPLPLTLQEVFYGGVKQVLIRKRELCDVTSEECPRMTKSAEVLLNIKFPPGVEPGTEYRFPEAGNQGITIIPADVIFVVEDIPHPVFKREGAKRECDERKEKKESAISIYNKQLELTLMQEDDEQTKFYSNEPTSKNGWLPPMSYLSTVKCITLCQALTGFPTTVNTIDGKLLRIPVTDIVRPTYQLVIPGEGLPILGDNDHSRGDLRLRFEIKFPIWPLPKKNRIMIQEALSSITDLGNVGFCSEDINRSILREKMNKVALKDQAPPKN